MGLIIGKWDLVAIYDEAGVYWEVLEQKTRGAIRVVSC